MSLIVAREMFGKEQLTVQKTITLVLEGLIQLIRSTIFGLISNKCVNGTSVTCKTDTEIEDYVRKTSILFGSGQSYFDFDDYNMPIKQV